MKKRTKKLTQDDAKRAKYTGKPYASKDGKPGAWPRQVLWDAEVPGFGLRLWPSGTKTFIFSYRVNGRKRLMALGEFGELNVERARKMALKERARVHFEDADPLEERQEKRERESNTVACLVKEYIERHAKPHKKTWKKDKKRLDAHIVPCWGTRTVASITRNEVAKLHGKLGAKAPYESNRLLEILRKMFNLAQDWGYLDRGSENPAVNVQRFREQKRDRWVQPNEMPPLAAAIEVESNPYIRAALWLYLITGVRKTELLRVKWEDIDFARREMRLSDTKSGRPQTVPLSNEAAAILRNIPPLEGNHHIFPGAKAGQHLVNIDKPWQRIRKAAKLEDVRLHDLRRTVGSMMASNGVSLLVIQKTLHHATPAPTQVYAHLSEDPRRAAMQDHARRLMTIAKAQEKTPDEVTRQSAQ